MSGKLLVMCRVLAHVIIVAVVLLALYVLFFFNHIPWFGRYEFPLLLRQWLPPLVVAASYAAWFYWRWLRLQKISAPKSPGQV